MIAKVHHDYKGKSGKSGPMPYKKKLTFAPASATMRRLRFFSSSGLLRSTEEHAVMKSTMWRSLLFAALWLVFSGETFAAEAVFSLSAQPPLPRLSRDVLLAGNEGSAMPVRRPVDEGIFKRRPQYAWPLYYHDWYRPAHERYYFGPLWMYEKKDGAVHHYPITISPYWRVLGYTTRGGSVEEIDVLSP